MRATAIANLGCAALTAIAFVQGAWAQNPCRYSYEIQEVRTPGTPVQVELYRSLSPGKHPLILVLVGSVGAFSRLGATAPLEDNLGEKTFAAHCFDVALPHYFDAIGRKSADDRNVLVRSFPVLLAAIRVIAGDESDLPEARNQPIGVFGESYGAYLAMALAATNRRIRAVSEISGGWPGQYVPPHGRPFACLASHGTADPIVPFSEAIRLTRALRGAGASVELRAYEGDGHYLPADVRHRIQLDTLRFFLRVLTPQSE